MIPILLIVVVFFLSFSWFCFFFSILSLNILFLFFIEFFFIPHSFDFFLSFLFVFSFNFVPWYFFLSNYGSHSYNCSFFILFFHLIFLI
jgi:hypothetical protein